MCVYYIIMDNFKWNLYNIYIDNGRNLYNALIHGIVSNIKCDVRVWVIWTSPLLLFVMEKYFDVQSSASLSPILPKNKFVWFLVHESYCLHFVFSQHTSDWICLQLNYSDLHQRPRKQESQTIKRYTPIPIRFECLPLACVWMCVKS